MNNIDQELQNTLELSFNESQTTNNSIVNINDIMKNLELADELFTKYSKQNECKICYDEKNCIKCGVCELFYCKMCIIRIMTQYNKCSACNNNFDINMIIKIHQINKNINTSLYQNNNETYNKEYGSSDSDLDKWLGNDISNKKKIFNLCELNLINPIKRKKKTKHYQCMYDYDNELLHIKSNYKNNNSIILNYKKYPYKEQQQLFIILDKFYDDTELSNKKWNEIANELKNDIDISKLFLDITKSN
jgi:hypothetical protein